MLSKLGKNSKITVALDVLDIYLIVRLGVWCGWFIHNSALAAGRPQWYVEMAILLGAVVLWWAQRKLL